MEVTELKDDENCNSYEFVVMSKHKGLRLDNYLSSFVNVSGESFSRAMFQQLIHDGHVRVHGKLRKNNYRLKTGDIIEVFIPAPEPVELIPEKINFDIIYEDMDIIVISKPPNLVVHPAAGNMTGTLVQGLLYHCKDLTGINGTIRPGIVHRLDKDTSGIMVIAKNDQSQQSLVSQFKSRSIHKKYYAVIDGQPTRESGTIRSLISRHPGDRKKMAVTYGLGKEAITHWKCVKSFGGFSLLEIVLETGRTHQIRVHLAHIGMPIVGDSVYGIKKKNNEYASLGVNRQFLHAFQLSFKHPSTGSNLSLEAPLFMDMADFIQRYDSRS